MAEKHYWSRQVKVVNYHGNPRKDLAKFHNTYRGLYTTRQELIDDAPGCLGQKNADTYDDGTEWYEIAVKVKVEKM